jgi:hypothetical protein
LLNTVKTDHNCRFDQKLMGFTSVRALGIPPAQWLKPARLLVDLARFGFIAVERMRCLTWLGSLAVWSTINLPRHWAQKVMPGSKVEIPELDRPLIAGYSWAHVPWMPWMSRSHWDHFWSQGGASEVGQHPYPTNQWPLLVTNAFPKNDRLWPTHLNPYPAINPHENPCFPWKMIYTLRGFPDLWRFRGTPLGTMVDGGRSPTWSTGPGYGAIWVSHQASWQWLVRMQWVIHWWDWRASRWAYTWSTIIPGYIPPQ